MNIKYIILLCLINYIATANSAHVTMGIQVDTPNSSAYSLADVISWSKKLVLVKIQDSSKLLMSAHDSTPQHVKTKLIKRMWSPKFVDDLVGNSYQSNWPSVISNTQLQNATKKRLLKEYKCRRVPGFISGYREEAVIVLATDNTHMPADMIIEPGFLMLFNSGALDYINLEYFKHKEDILMQVEVTNWELLLPLPDGSLVESAERLLLEKKWPRVLVEAIVGKYNQNSWPSGIRGTRLQNPITKEYLRKYKCRRVPGILSDNQEQAVIVFASDNTHMPADMIAKPGILMVFKQGAFPINEWLASSNCPIM